LQTTPEQVRLCVYDNGRGFDPEQIPSGRLGLGIMRERAAAIGSRMQVESAPGEGTRITVEWHPPDTPAEEIAS
jgi:signal transduction histidine kinase